MARAQNIKVQPETIRAYGKKAQTHFDQMRQALQIMVNTIDRVEYEGDNAAYFKNTCGEMAAEFSANFVADMGSIADAVRITTSNIAQALGGQPITIKVNGNKIVPQRVAKAADGTQSANTASLQALPTIMGTNFDRIRDHLKAHLKDLQATGWEGNGKKTAVEQVSAFTTRASGHTTDAEQEIVKFINAQLDALDTADK